MRSRFWSVISVLAFVAAILCWLEGDRRRAANAPPVAPASAAPAPATNEPGAGAAAPQGVRLLSNPGILMRQPAVVTATSGGPAPAASPDALLPMRLRNVDAPLGELSRRDTAVLLRNALIDTAGQEPLDVPAVLRSTDAPGAYIVQARGNTTDGLRERIRAAGGRLVSYVPNNAYLVRLSPAGAAELQDIAQAVLPFDPYFKLEPGLLKPALEGTPPDEGALLLITGYAEDRDATLESLQGLGAAVLVEGRGNVGFGPEPQFLVDPRGASFAALAGLAGVQLIEASHERSLLVDLTRERLGVALDTVTLTNHLGLTGSNVWVNVNDTGIWGDHPDLEGRVFAHGTNLLEDPYGHGTHVAGIIASTGANGPTGTNVPPGSLTNATFRGFATNASLFVLPVDPVTGPLVSDTFLQEVAAATNYNTLERTNALISNNSWGYARAFEYNSAAASYDAAVRDSLPDQTGSQPVMYVFAAGNAGFGNNVGSGGFPGSITSPGTAKNVITVGAVENLREITLEVVSTNQVTNIVDGEFVVTNVVETNQIPIEISDSNDEIAAFSSRGNVGLGVEGDRGRFKPDLVAPGVFIASTRATNWTVDFIRTNSTVFTYPAQVVQPEDWNNYSIQVPALAKRLTISTVPEPASPDPFPALRIYTLYGAPPTPADLQGTGEVVIDDPQEGPWYYAVENPTQTPVTFTLRVRIDVQIDSDDYLDLITDINEPLEPYYRFDTGTSASAAAVSGMLALMQEFFERQIEQPYSPALMKALLINGARSVSPLYNLEVRSQVNYQGWGLPLFTNVLPATITNNLEKLEEWPLRWVDQHPTNALATGETHAYDLEVPTNAILSDLRVTLVWTDPPGNPAASIKLVNDLDLVVSNKTTGTWYFGNDIPASSDYNRPNTTNEIVGLPDNINNVENVFLRQPIDTNYTVLVSARRVNVNAVTAHTNGIVQDYALVMSVGGTNALKLTPQTPVATNFTEATIITNGVPILYQRAGAHSPLIGKPEFGTTNQWHFYVFTNRYDTNLTGGETNFGKYVAFLTFTPPNLSVPRTAEEGDIDMYVTRTGPGAGANPGASNLTRLDPAQMAAAATSLTRLGTELVAFENAAIGEVFYIGIKSEDQMSAEYGIIGLSSDEPFGSLLPDGSYEIYGRPLPRDIPDGSPNAPGAALVFGVGVYPMVVGRAIVYNAFTHEEAGDLLGNLSHSSRFVVLNNHSPAPEDNDGYVAAIYDDTGNAIEPLAQPSDGPGSLVDFIGSQGTGVWQFTMIDNGLAHTGRVEELTIRLFPAPDLMAGSFVTLQPNQFNIFYVDVPADATLLRILLSQMTLPIDVFARYEAPPTLTDFDKSARIPPPSGEMTVGQTDIPPLRPGRYFVGVFNPNGVATTFYIRAAIERALAGPLRRDLVGTNAVPLQDDLRMFFTNYVDNALAVAEVMVGIRASHPRLSDLAFSLISPQGTRTILAENRGATNRTTFGYDTVNTNFHHVALTYSTNTGLAILYLDGAEQGRRVIGPVTPDTRQSLHLGRQPASNFGFSGQFLGQLDEVDLYGRALQASEILGIYRYGGAGKPTNELVSRWSFDGNGADSMGNNPASVLGPTFVPGRFRGGLDFRAEGDHVLVTNSSGLDVGLRSGFTLDAWVNPFDLSTNRVLAAWSNGTNTLGVEFGIRAGSLTNLAPGVLYANLRDRSGSNHVVEAATQGLIRTNGFFTNVVYVSFTDDTNLALVPIKFAEPDTAPIAQSTNRLVSGFEAPTSSRVTTLNVDDVFDGWTVDAGRPSVLTGPLAHTGTNLLVLRDGSIYASVPTVPDRAYRLQFAHRREPLPDDAVSWWDGQDSLTDILSTNDALAFDDLAFAAGKVGRSFALTNTARLEVPHADALSLTNELSIEFWYLARNYGPAGTNLIYKAEPAEPTLLNYFVNLSSAGVDVGFNDPDQPGVGSDLANGVEGIRYNPLPALNVFHHLAATFRQVTPTQVELTLYLDGVAQRAKVLNGLLVNTASAGPLVIGRGDFDGLLDEITVYSRALRADEVQEIFWMDALGKARPPALPATLVRVDRAANTVFASDPLWLTNGLTFLATRTNTLVEIVGVQPGVMLDSVEVRELPATTFFPEEPLKPFVGENALGDWKLEVVDRRVGATNDLLDAFIRWQLQLTFAPIVVPAVTLTNGVIYTNTLPAGQARYFIVDVPLEARRATNTLGATVPLDLWFNHAGIPTYGASGTDYHVLTNLSSGIAVVLTNEMQVRDTNHTLVASAPAPVLEPGQRYYLALTNQSATSTPFSIQVDFDQVTGDIAGVRNLGWGQVIRTNIAAGTAMQFFRYNVTSNAIGASFQVTPTDGDVHLYLRKGTTSRNPLPTPQTFDYASENVGTNPETILVTQDSVPVPLSSGPWYLGVLNVDTHPVNYSVRVLEYTNVTDQVIDLQPDVTQTATVNPAGLSRLYFRFTATGSPAAVQFDLAGLTGNAELYVKQGSNPSPFDYEFMDAAAPGLPARLVIRTSVSGANLNGEWYLQVYNLEAGPISFGITASYPPPGPVIWNLRDSIPFQATLGADLPGQQPVPQYFSFIVPEGATNVLFQLTPLNGNVDMLVRRGALPDLANFDYFSFNGGTAVEAIVVDAESLPAPLAPGEWFVAVYSGATTSTTYEMLARSLPPGLSGEVTIDPHVEIGVNGVTIRWTAAPNLNFQVQYATRIAADGSIPWITIPGLVTSSTTAYAFTDDGSQTGGLGAFKFYRVVLVSSGGGGVLLDPHVQFDGAVAVLRWSADPDLNFQVEYATSFRANGSPAWVAVPGSVTSTTGNYEFRDDGSLTGGAAAMKLYRVRQLP